MSKPVMAKAFPGIREDALPAFGCAGVGMKKGMTFSGENPKYHLPDSPYERRTSHSKSPIGRMRWAT
jgi:hypothetical protein